jgi:DNA-binding transcriptional LysR family regulator
MKLTALRDFLEVVERGSLRAAARHQGGAQPTISRSINGLEKELGVVLFERKARGVQLTPMGERFYVRARAVQADLRRAQEELDQLKGRMHGRVSVALSSVPQIALLPGALRPFRQRFPDVRLDIIDAVFPAIEKDLKSGALDCYIGAVPEYIGSELVAEKLFDNQRAVVGRKGHPLRHARTLKEVAGAEWVMTSVTRKAEEEFGPIFKQHGLPTPRVGIQVHSAFSVVVTLVSSDLLTLLPTQWARSPMLGDVLEAIPIKEAIAGPPIGIIRRAALPLTPAAEYFCDMMRREAGSKSAKAQGSTR